MNEELLGQVINLVTNFQNILNEIIADNKALKNNLETAQIEIIYWKDRYNRESKRANELYEELNNEK